ncbi:Predicted pyridoxal phosphate-dependent enzyme, YBL036C type [Prunus dulcis]|uniref:Pyridoxal phosphate homeostasis protein n=1 Tax=Prunus dulcis TaxID=3755 RepID=A0A4Y1RCV4_PRUDU|nr:Predicted pyridoxal phosphate-dependent enzyme, YBL036C type [Prunus dulcis]
MTHHKVQEEETQWLYVYHMNPTTSHFTETRTKAQEEETQYTACMAAPAVEIAAVSALRSVMLRVRHAAERSGRNPGQVRVVAVSKTKPVSLIRQVYDAGHRRFGENYVQEILDKAPQFSIAVSKFIYFYMTDIRAGVPNLALVEGVDNEKIANHLDRAVSNLGRNPLKVLVQVNTSGEVSKSGIDPSGCVELAKHVKFRCPNLEFSGLMTIGMPDYTSTPENFRMLSKCRAQVCKALDMAEEHCELSMGMSGDFEQAIEMGSTNVRIGSTIFGPRDYAKKQPD